MCCFHYLVIHSDILKYKMMLMLMTGKEISMDWLGINLSWNECSIMKSADEVKETGL